MFKIFLSIKALFVLIVLIASLVQPSFVQAKIKAKSKVQKHFDINEDGYLSLYENELYKTHKHFKYPLAKKKKQKPYDFNGDLMLQPFEKKMYLKDKKAGKLKKYSKKDKKNRLRR